MSAKKLPPKHESLIETLTYEDVGLMRKYSVMEIAILAAGCRGETGVERINDAVELLALVERYALSGKETRRRIRDSKKAKESGAELKSSVLVYSALQEQFQKAVEIRGAATRDKKTGKIELTSLVGLAYEAATGGKADSSEAKRRYNQWAKEEASEDAVTVEKFKARYASGTNPAVIHDDNVAINLGMQLIGYLEKPSKRKPAKIIRSKKPETKNKIVSPKTRGSDIANGTERGRSKAGKPRKRGQFKPKQPVVVDEYRDSGRSSRTKTHGKHPD